MFFYKLIGLKLDSRYTFKSTKQIKNENVELLISL